MNTVRNHNKRANAVSEREKPFEKLDFQLCCVNKCKTKKERQTTKQEHGRKQLESTELHK